MKNDSMLLESGIWSKINVNNYNENDLFANVLKKSEAYLVVDIIMALLFVAQNKVES